MIRFVPAYWIGMRGSAILEPNSVSWEIRRLDSNRTDTPGVITPISHINILNVSGYNSQPTPIELRSPDVFVS